MVTKNLINYCAPIQRCPTKDNAYVDIVINFGFKLPTDAVPLMNFVYKLGAARFDELLSAEVEENVRNFIQETWLGSVLDVKSDMAKAQTDQLNKKFRQYNIQFENPQVTKVNVSPQFSQALEQKTNIKYAKQNHIKEQQNLRLVLQNEETQLLTDQQRENERKMYELRQEISRAETDKEQDEIQASTKKEQAIQHAQGDASAQITKAEGQKARIVSEIKGKTVTEINEAKAASNKLMIQTD